MNTKCEFSEQVHTVQPSESEANEKSVMDKLKELLEKYLDIDLQQIIISGARAKSEVSKIRIRPILLRDNLMYQFTKTVGAKELHSNHAKDEATQMICNLMSTQFKQLQLEHRQMNASVLVSKKGQITIKQKIQNNNNFKQQDLSHNRQKQYLLDPEKKVGFLMDLGVMSRDGKIVKSHYDKFRQINRFLEFIDDIIWKLPTDREIVIIDFGCGKSYLTFAMYYYLKELKNLDIRIVGLDLKADVIDKCNRLSKKYGYEKLDFVMGDIASYDKVSQVDMVVTLHACDTATDLAIAKAVKWNAAVILSVPCCQHELNTQIKNEILAPVLSYGIIKERIAALVTDGLRAQMLEGAGYDAQILEFVDMEHTPKNLLIRAVKTDRAKDNATKLTECMDFLAVNPMLKELLDGSATGEHR